LNAATKAINNVVCAYRDCAFTSQVRLHFSLGFSALFCEKCAAILLRRNLAIKTMEISTDTISEEVIDETGPG
jgi:hypothetical protein